MTSTATTKGQTMNITTADLRIYTDPNEYGLAWSFRSDAEGYDDLSGAYGPTLEDNDEADEALRDLWGQVRWTAATAPWNVEDIGVNVSGPFGNDNCVTISGDADRVRAFAATLGLNVR